MKLSLLKSLICTLIIGLFYSAFGVAQQGSISINQDKNIEKLLEAKKELNKDSNDYYKIQIYSGDRSKAESSQSNFNSSFAWPSKIVYETPNFKIWVGNFRSRLEADRALQKIKEKFPSAFIFKPKK